MSSIPSVIWRNPLSFNPLFWMVITLIAAGFIWLKQKARDNPLLPPGPKPIFVLGNIRDITSSKEVWLPATRWAKEFGAFSVHRKNGSLISISRQRCLPAYFGTGSCVLEYTRGRL